MRSRIEAGIEVVMMMETKTKHFLFPLFLNPQASLVWIMAGVGLECCRRDTGDGDGHSGPGSGVMVMIVILEALRMVGVIRATIWSILPIPCLIKSCASHNT